ncbi:MAG: hypothetical protein JXI33_07020 [Candidatus Aminicenantes bacterium]|nr:hypothetical protein [Candidatus Aminicenantes bacterium]
MIKKQQKWIAILVVCTFLWLMQLSTMPVAAAGQADIAGAEQEPDYFEASGQSAAPANKRNILPYVLIGVGVVAVAAVLFLVVLKTNYDITGTWSLTYSWAGGTCTYDTIFTGTKDSGTLIMNNAISGSYTVDGKKVSCYVADATRKWEFVGEFTSKTEMGGQLNYYYLNVLYPEYGGTFSAVKK